MLTRLKAFLVAYRKCLADMVDMVMWIRNDLVPQRAYMIVKKLWICVFATQFVDLVLPLCIGLVQSGATTNKAISDYQLINKIVLRMQSFWPSFDVGTCYIAIGVTAHLILTAIFYNIVAYYRFKLSETMCYFNFWEMSKRVSEKFYSKSIGVIDNEDNGLSEASLKKGYDRIERIQNIAIFQGPEIVARTILILVSMIWIYDYWPIRVAVICMALVHFIWGVCLNYMASITCDSIEESWRFFHRYRNERWEQAKMVKINNKVTEEIDNMKKLYDKAAVPDCKFWGMDNNFQVRFRVVAIHFFLAVIIGYGAYLAKANILTIGMLYPLLWWSNQLVGNLWQLADIENNFNKCTPAILLMKKALDLPVGIKMVKEPVKIKKGTPMIVEFINATCSYPPDKDSPDMAPVVLKNVNLKINPGDKIGVVGPSGIGKSTLIGAALRFRDLISGRILINGINIEEYDPYSLYDNISYIGQSSENLNGTVKYNFEYSMTSAEIRNTPRAVYERLAEDLDLCNGARWAKGIDTLIGYGGRQLSGGQKQRVAIGRAIMKRAPMLFADEITSSVDSTTEKRVQKVLRKWLGDDVTVFMVSHHYATLRSICTKFVMIDAISESDPNEGSTIVAVANSLEELAEMCPKFRQLALDQDMVL